MTFSIRTFKTLLVNHGRDMIGQILISITTLSYFSELGVQLRQH